MQRHRSFLSRNSAIRRAGVATTLLLVVVSGAVATNKPAAADACPIDVGRSYGYTLQAAQTALAAVTDTCRTLMFTAGTYQFNGTFPITASSVTVTGEPGAVITATAGVSLIDGLIKVSGSGVSLKDLALDGSGASTDGILSSGPSSTITGTSVSNVSKRAIWILTTATDASISGCKVSGFGDRGVATQAARTSVDGCTVTGGQGHGMWAYGGADQASFTNNTISNNLSMGMEFINATNFTASGNVLHDNHKLGIHMLRSNTGTVSNNISHHNGSNGIDAHGSTFVTISGNKSYFNGGPRTVDSPVEGQGILVYCSQNIKVLSNTVWDNAQSQPGDRNGIQVSDNGGQNGELPTRDITVDRNLSYDDQSPPTQGWAIRLGGNVTSVTPDLDYITVTNNRGYGNINSGLYTGGLAPNATVTIANNSLGDGSTTVPDPPTNVTATAGDAAATVSWTAPASDGGSPITGYTVTPSSGPTTTAAAGATSATVSGLTNGTSYTFTVTATNAVGDSAASSPSTAVTPQAAPPTAPDPPTNVTATAGDASATVSWTAPASNGGSAITGYTVTSSAGGATTAAAGATSATVSGLTNGASYTFTVTATNAVGTSAASNVSNSVTPRAAATAVTTVQETAPAVSYNSWAGVTDPASSGGSYRISKTANATVSVKFTGSSIKWLMRKGPDRGQAAVTIDGVGKGTVDLYAANPSNGSQTYSSLTANAHTIVIKVLGTKRTLATAANVTVDAFLVGATTTPVQDNSPSVTFDSWTGAVNASADGGSYRASATAGATATFTFSGTRVDWITARGPRYGKASVSVDGGKAVTVDLYSATQKWRVVGWSFTGLSSGAHTLTIKVLGVKNAASSGIKVLVDALAIVPTVSANLAAASSGTAATAPPYAGQRGTAGSGDGPGAGFPAGGTPGIGARGDRTP